MYKAGGLPEGGDGWQYVTYAEGAAVQIVAEHVKLVLRNWAGPVKGIERYFVLVVRLQTIPGLQTPEIMAVVLSLTTWYNPAHPTPPDV